MIKKLLLAILIFFIMIFAQPSFAQELFKVTSINLDTSNSVIFLTSPDNTVAPILKNIKLVKLSNPTRAYFDIESAVLTTPGQNWFFNSGGLKQIKVGQFSTNPNVIRTVMYFDDGFDPKKVQFLKINNNIAIKFKESMCQENFFQMTYRDEKSSSSDFYEKLSISSEDDEKVKQATNAQSDAVINQIQQAFNSTQVQATKPVSAKTTEVAKKNLKLNSKYYLNSIELKENGVLISGFGSAGVEKPMYLTDPARVVFDVSNTIINPELKNKELKINEKESVKIGQFSQNKARIVITSPDLEKYLPVFSADAQSVLFVNVDKIDVSTLFTKTTDAVAYYHKTIPPQSDEFIMAFNAPVVHGIKRDYSKVTIYLYNALRYNDPDFKNAIKATGLGNMKIELIPKIGLKLVIPVEKDNVVNTYLGADAKSIKVIIKGLKPVHSAQSKTTDKSSITTIIAPIRKKAISGKGKVVIDPGHGGVDYGAIRAGINEKDINLDVAKRIEAILINRGVSVEMTRKRDETVSLQDRTIFSACKDPDIFVSVHVNSSVRPEITGIETHYYHQESLELAQTVHSCLASYIKSKDRGLFKSKFYVINHTEVPAILVEIGFISNDCERAELVSEKRKQQTAQAIAEGILKYLKK